jgi:hypothetical protein
MYLPSFILSFALFLYSTLKEGIIISSAILYPLTVMAANPQPKQVSCKLIVILKTALSLHCLHVQFIY